jgi:hypothetical protein
VTLVAVSVPSLKIPPPPSRPSLFSTRTALNVRVAEFQMAPARTPVPENPFCTVRFEMVTEFAVGKTSKTRSMPLAGLPVVAMVMIVLVAPAPLMVIGVVTSRSPVLARSSPAPARERVTVPASTLMTSAAALAFASCTAARNVHTPPAVAQMSLPMFASTASPVLLTVKVRARAGAAAASATASPTRTARARPAGPGRELQRVFMGRRAEL